MKMKIRFDTAWAILIMVGGTLVTTNFMDDEHARNVLAGIVLLSCFVLFTISITVRRFRLLKEYDDVRNNYRQ